MHNRNWEVCNDSKLCSIYDEVWSYISLNYEVDNCPLFYLNKSNSIHNLGLFALDDYKRPVVVLNKKFINYPDKATNTIIHELTHYLAWELYNHKNQNHNYRWQELARKVGKHFNESITTYCEDNHPVLNACKKIKKDRKISNIKYIVQCDKCKHQYIYLRKSRIIKSLLIDPQYSRGTCPRCNGHKFQLHINNIRQGDQKITLSSVN